MNWIADLLLLFFCYVVGCFPSGLAIGLKLYGKDLRTMGSGNIGATNAWRQLGKKAGILVFALDVGKAVGAVLLAGCLGAYHLPEIAILAGIAVLLGNFFNAFLGFSGGKGVATSLGVFLALAPKSVLLALLLFIIIVKSTRYVALGSILAAIAMPFLVYCFQGTGPLLIMMSTISILVIVKHHSNIRRLLSGTENKV